MFFLVILKLSFFPTFRYSKTEKSFWYTYILLGAVCAFQNIYTYIYNNTQQSSSYMATYHPSRKLWKLDDPDMLDTAEEVGTSS